jgi:ATP-binding cassette subfamily F protein 3
MKFILPAPLPLEGVKSCKKPIHILSNVSYAHGDKFLGKTPPKFTACNFSMSQASRALVIGAKGSGKTAFAMLLANRVPPTTGTVRRVEGLRVAYLSQQSLTDLASHNERCAERCCAWLSTLAWLRVSEPKIDDFDNLSKGPPSGPHGASWREHLRAFGFDLDSLSRMKVSSLSTAAKASLLIAASFWQRPQIVVLDDPGNWLDTMATQALLEALAIFKGGVVVTSLS